MEDIITVIKGTELKVLFTADIDGNSSINFDQNEGDRSKYTLLYYTTDKSTALVCSSDEDKNTLEHKVGIEGNNTILIRIPTEGLDVGTLRCEATLLIYDSDFHNDLESKENAGYDQYRTEIIRENTKIKIIE